MQQIVASHGLSNIFSLVYWSEKPEVKSPCTSVMCRCKQTKTKCQTKVANHTDVADIVVNSACFHVILCRFSSRRAEWTPYQASCLFWKKMWGRGNSGQTVCLWGSRKQCCATCGAQIEHSCLIINYLYIVVLLSAMFSSFVQVYNNAQQHYWQRESWNIEFGFEVEFEMDRFELNSS